MSDPAMAGAQSPEPADSKDEPKPTESLASAPTPVAGRRVCQASTHLDPERAQESVQRLGNATVEVSVEVRAVSDDAPRPMLSEPSPEMQSR